MTKKQETLTEMWTSLSSDQTEGKIEETVLKLTGEVQTLIRCWGLLRLSARLDVQSDLATPETAAHSQLELLAMVNRIQNTSDLLRILISILKVSHWTSQIKASSHNIVQLRLPGFEYDGLKLCSVCEDAYCTDASGMCSRCKQQDWIDNHG